MEKAALIDIIRKSKDGDMEAMEKLLLHAHTSVSYQCRKMLKNEQDAEDMTQEVLVTVYQKLDTLQEPAAFGKWLHRITAARCINALNRTPVEFQIAEDEEGHSILNTLEEMDEKKIPEKWLDNQETTRMIEEIVDGLPDVQRMCTLMFYYSEMSVREISRIMKVSENTVKSRLNYARKAIKEKVLDYEKKGVKLYGLSPLPFLYYFLHRRKEESRDPAAAQIMVTEILAQSAFVTAGVVNAVGSVAAGGAGSAAAAAAGSAEAAAATGTPGFLGVLGSLSAKVIAGVLAALVTVGGITAAAIAGDESGQEQTFPTVALEEQDDGSGSEDDLVLETVEAVEIPEETDATTETTESGGEETASTGTEPKESSDGNENSSVGSVGNTSSGSGSVGNTSSGSGQASEGSTAAGPTDGGTEEDTGDDTTEIDLTTHTHQYVVSYTQEPCCQEQGYTEYKCSLCGDYYFDDFTETLPHSYTVTVVAPTAYSQGYTKYECTAVCSHMHANYSTFCLDTYITDYTDKLASDTDTSGCTHSFIETTITAATCYGEGIQKYTCENCGFAYTEVVPKYTKHEWVLEEGIATAPGCDWDGNEGYWCAHCRLWKPDDIIPALGHDYTTVVVAPTATSMGYTEFTCSRCGESFKDNYTEALPDGTTASHSHSYSSVVTAPTCSEPGYTIYTCACGHSYKGDIVSPAGCKEVETVVEPTATMPGYTEKTCTVCGISVRYNYTDLLEDGTVTTHEHSYTNVVETAPTCTKSGRIAYTCICGESSRYEFLEATGHSYEVTEDTSTCTEAGIQVLTCTECGDSFTAEVSERGHEYITTVVPPTETEQGYTEYTCSACGDTYKDSYTDPVAAASVANDPHIHSYASTVTAAACTSNGYTTYTCICGDSYTADETPAAGHSYTATVVAPTETSQGYTEHTCTACGDSYTDSYTDMLTSE